ncbi:hypothetical protein K7X08_026650 [Anisodus acutangulus]|uniref:RNase H type-1 domain-containing protein n=1 Tax=Anisodus acutangulus TaxID=402998 RepID=A0A9Q1LBA8_9SOLA|nr:hypothetical protein K7X08_026650 [Anisodus acutangulus]
MDSVTLGQVHEAIMILWELWNASINSLMWHEKSLQSEVVIQKAVRFWQDWTKARTATSSPIASRTDFEIKWFPPDENVLKCNSDASFDLSSGVAGVNVLVRDSHGNFIRGRSSQLDRPHGSLMAETLDVREALSWLKEHFTATSIIVEIDIILVKQVLEKSCGNNSYFDVIIRDCKDSCVALHLFLCLSSKDQRISVPIS